MLKVEQIALTDIFPYWNNARNNKKAIKVVEKSIKKYGFNQPIAIDAKSEIIAGHTRYFAAMNLGMIDVPCVRLELTEEQAKQYRIADNKTHEYATWDEEKLIRELRVIEDKAGMQDFFFESIEDIIGFKLPSANDQAKDGDVFNVGSMDNDPDENDEPMSFTENQVDKFNSRVDKANNELDQKPTEYIKFNCPKCGEEIVIKK